MQAAVEEVPHVAGPVAPEPVAEPIEAAVLVTETLAVAAEPVVEPQPEPAREPIEAAVEELPHIAEPVAPEPAQAVEETVALALEPVVEPAAQMRAPIEAQIEQEAPFETAEPRLRAQSAGVALSVEFAAPAGAAAQWSKTALDLWTESAVGLLNLASDLCRAKTAADVVGAQSRYAQERFAGLTRFSNDSMELARAAAKEAGAAAPKFFAYDKSA